MLMVLGESHSFLVKSGREHSSLKREAQYREVFVIHIPVFFAIMVQEKSLTSKEWRVNYKILQNITCGSVRKDRKIWEKS